MTSCKEKIKNMVKKVDLFGTFINFRVEKEREYKSLVGGASTIIYITIALIYILYMAIPFIKRKEIYFTFSNKILNQSPFVNLTSSNFMFAFGLLFKSDDSGAIEDTIDLFDYSITLREWIGIDEINDINIPFQLCHENDFGESLKDQFELNELFELYCPNFNNMNFSLDGLYTDDYYKYIIISVKISDYAKNNLNYVEDFIRNNPIIMSIFFKDSAINYENKKEPIPEYINYIYKDIEIDYIKNSIVFISTLEFKDDQKYFFTNNKIIKENMFDRTDDSFRINTYLEEGEKKLINDDLFSFELRASPKIVTLKRRYQKIPEFIASLSGLLSFLLVCNVVIANLIQRKIIDQILIHKMIKFNGNKLYNIQYLIKKFNNLNNTDNKDYELNMNEKTKFFNLANNYIYKKNIKEDNKILNKNLIQLESKNNLNEKKRINIFSRKKINELSSLNSNRQFIISKKKRNTNLNYDIFELSICEIIGNIFCFFCYTDRKYDLIQKAENKIYYYMDIETYITLIQEFQMFKNLYFDEEYLNIFTFISKPSMRIEKNNLIFKSHNKTNNISLNKFKKKQIDDLYNKYKELFQKKNLSNDKTKMLEILKNEILFFKDIE